MTDPTSPGAPVPVDPPVVPQEVAVQSTVTAGTQAAVAQVDPIRDLATAIQQPALDFDPATIRKGTITAIDVSTDPPTVSIQLSGDTSITIPGVRYLDSYSPVLNDIAIILKQNTDILVAGRVASTSATGWITATLTGGFSHNANGGGNLQYRKVWDSGNWKIQWKGMVGRSSGTTIISALPSDIAPSTAVSLIAARDSNNGQCAVKVDVSTAGAVSMTDGTMTSTSSASGTGQTGTTNQANSGFEGTGLTGGSNQGFSSIGGAGLSGGSNQGFTGFTSGHNHTVGHEHQIGTHNHTIGHEHGGPNHSHTIGHEHAGPSHTHTTLIDFPTVISFHGLEYFL